MPAGAIAKKRRRSMAAFILLFSLLLFLSWPLFFSSPALSEPDYSYSAFHTVLTINSDGSLRVRNKVTYEFQDAGKQVRLFVPASFGRLVEAQALKGDGSPLPEGSWGFEQTAEVYTLWVDSSGSGATASYIFDYLLYEAFEVNGDRTGIPYWSGVPEYRTTPIDETSVTLRFPSGADPELIDLDVSTFEIEQITQRFIGSNTAVIEATYLSGPSSYSFSCFWPSSLMDLSGVGFASAQEKSWDFERFDTEITVNEDSSYTVRETQVVNFRGSFTWLDRDLSTAPADFGEGRTYGRVRIHDIEVFDLDGQPYDRGMWSVESSSGEKKVHIEFSARDEQRGWVIEYRMTGAFIFAEEYDRLVWDAVSQDREVPIRAATITAHLPPGTNLEEVRTSQYLDISRPPSSYESGVEGDMLWWRVQEIPPYSTFTIDVALPKGAVAKPWQYDRACGIAVIAASSFLFAAVLLGMVFLWWRKGRDIGRTGTSMVRYDPPGGLTPAMVGMLVNQKPRVEDISATIVDLARRGYLTIIEEERRSLIRIKQYGFQRNSTDLSALLPYEREIMDGLFAAGERVSETDLKNKFYTHVDDILQDGVKSEVMKRKLFTTEPGALRKRYITAGVILAALPLAALFILPRWFDLGWFALLLLAFIPMGIVVAGVGWAMPSRSREGSRAYEHAMGFREYMETAEKPEMEYMTPESFQANLPYAMVLGVVDAWAQKFKDIYTTPPQWYAGSGTAFSTAYLASSLSDMTGRLNGTLTSSPSSSGSGGGGFGGGSSGGGFGGGGSSAG